MKLDRVSICIFCNQLTKDKCNHGTSEYYVCKFANCDIIEFFDEFRYEIYLNFTNNNTLIKLHKKDKTDFFNLNFLLKIESCSTEKLSKKIKQILLYV